MYGFSDTDADLIWVDQFGHVDYATDITGKRLYRRDHGNTWDLDHIKPKSKGGSNTYSNLQVLNMIDNREYKRDNFPTWVDQNGVSHTQYRR